MKPWVSQAPVMDIIGRRLRTSRFITILGTRRVNCALLVPRKVVAMESRPAGYQVYESFWGVWLPYESGGKMMGRIVAPA